MQRGKRDSTLRESRGRRQWVHALRTKDQMHTRAWLLKPAASVFPLKQDALNQPSHRRVPSLSDAAV
jgi:hypothetical protein